MEFWKIVVLVLVITGSILLASGVVEGNFVLAMSGVKSWIIAYLFNKLKGDVF